LYETSREIIDVTNESAGALRVVEMGGRGRAVVAAGKIRREQLVERAPVLVVEEEERAVLDASSIGAHIFMWEHGSVGDDLYSGKGRAAIVLGLASLVNHSATPNCRFVRHIEARALDVIALRLADGFPDRSARASLMIEALVILPQHLHAGHKVVPGIILKDPTHA
jgi:uncharacterized protein